MANARASKSSERQSCSQFRSPPSSARMAQRVKQERLGKSVTPSSDGLETPSEKRSPFLFINTTEKSTNGKQNVESRMLVRSHVMNTFYRKKSSPQDFDEILPRDSEVGGKTSKFRLESYSGRRKGRRRKEKACDDAQVRKKESNETSGTEMSISPSPPLGKGLFDPFGAAALPWDSNMQSLVRHYIADIPNSIHPLKYNMYHVQNFILKMGVADDALLHAIVAYSMIHKFCFGSSTIPSEAERIHYSTSNPDVLGHQTQAIHLVNKKLGAGIVGDVTIATVLILLWHHPWIQGAGEDEALIHFTGLKQMVQCRGGLEELPAPLSNSITFHDLKRSMLHCTNPQMHLRSRPQSSASDLSVTTQNTESIFYRSPTYLLPLLGTELWQILLDLNQFTDFVAYYRSISNVFGPSESVLFEHWNSSLEHRIFSYSPSSQTTVPNLSDENFKEALRLTAGLWMSTGLWSFPLSASLVTSVAGRLVDVLVDSDLGLWRRRFPDMLLWILVIGACCTPVEGFGRAFFVGQLREIDWVRGFGGKGDLVNGLRSFIYMEGAYAGPLARLWGDMVEEGKG